MALERRPKSTPSRFRKRKYRIFFVRLVRKASSTRFSVDFCRFLVFCKVCEPSEVPHLPAKTKVRCFALQFELLAHCNIEKRQKSNPKSTRNRQNSIVLGLFGGRAASDLAVLGASGGRTALASAVSGAFGGSAASASAGLGKTGLKAPSDSATWKLFGRNKAFRSFVSPKPY